MKKFIIFPITMLLAAFIYGQDIKKDSMFYMEGYYSTTDQDYEKIKTEYQNLNFKAWLMPGPGYTFYRAKGADSTVVFKGVAVKYLIYAKNKSKNTSGYRLKHLPLLYSFSIKNRRT